MRKERTDIPENLCIKNSLHNIKKILVIRIGAIGDFVQTLPTIYALRKRFPEAHLEIMGYISIAELTEGRFYANAISRFDQKEMACFWGNPEHNNEKTKLPSSLVKYFGSFDLIISFLNNAEKNFLVNLRRIQGPQVINFNSFPPETKRIHVVDHLLLSLKPLGIVNYERIPKIFLKDDDMDLAEQFLRKHDLGLNKREKIIAIHPGSGNRKKCWQVDKFAEIVCWLKKKLSAKILIISGPADENNVLNLLEKVSTHNPVIFTDLSIVKLAAILKTCDLFIGNDSGITHISAAVQIPTIAIFGPTDPNVWGPRGKFIKILKNKVFCSPCSANERNLCKRQICLENITVEDVIAAVNSIFQSK